MPQRFILLTVIFLGSACAQVRLLPYLDQALVLKSFGQDKDAQTKYVKNTNAAFDRLWSAVESKEIEKYKTQKEIIKNFGEPILYKTVFCQGQDVKRALYRYAIQRYGPHKVYVYYDDKGKVLKVDAI